MRRLLILAVSVLLIAPKIAQACTINWTGQGGDNYWTTAGNWDTGRIPGANDDVCIGGGFVVNTVDGKNIGTILSLTLGGTLTLNDVSTVLTSTSTASTINKLILNGPNTQSVLTVNGTANFTGTLTLSDGAIEGPGTATFMANVKVLGGQSFHAALTTYTTTNQGTIAISSNVQLALGAVSFVNASNGLIDLQGDGITIAGGGTFNNLGSIVKSNGNGGTSTFAPSGTFTNNGKIIGAENGVLKLSPAFPNTGTFSASSGATLQFTNIVTLNNGTKFIGSGTVDIANGVWDVETLVTVDTTNLTFDGGQPAIRGSSDLIIKSTTVIWNSGTLGAQTGNKMTLAKQATMQIMPVGAHSLAMNLDQLGTVNMSADLSLNGATVTIKPKAMFNILTDNGISGQGTINNSGMFQKTMGSGISNIAYYGTFNIMAPKDSFPVTANTGTLNFAVNSGGKLGGVWTAGSGATLEFSMGAYVLPDGFKFAGAGTTLLTQAAWLLPGGNVSVGTSAFTFNGPGNQSSGVINGTGNLKLNSPNSTWTGGWMGGIPGGGKTTIPAGITLTVKNGVKTNEPALINWTLDNKGTTVIADSTSAITLGGSTWNNNGRLEFLMDGNVTDNGNGASTFNNSGTVEKKGGTLIDGSSITFSGTFNNNGKVIADKGELKLGPSQGMSAGEFIAVNRAVYLIFSAGTWEIKPGTTMSGNGTIQLASTVTWNLMADLDVQSHYFDMHGATITGAFNLTVENVAFLGGARTGGGTIKIPNADSVVYVSSPLTLDASTLDTSADRFLVAGNGTVAINNGAVLLNEQGGRILLGVIEGNNTPAVQVNSGTFSNLGTVTESTRGGENPTQTIGGTVPMQNKGTISVPGGHTLVLSAGLDGLGGAVATLPGGTILTGDTFTIQGGTFGGDGAASGPVNNTGGIVGAGKVNPGSGTGILNLNASYTQGTGGAISALIRGTTAGTQYDQIDSTSSMALAGTLNLLFGSGFTPAPSDKFNILNFSSVSGNFSTVNAPTGWTAHLNFTGTALNVQFSKNGLSVSINPKVAMVKVNGTTQFTGKVVGASKKTWRVKESGGGTVTQSGLYAAPAMPGTYHLVVTSVADGTKSDTATVTVTALADKLTVTPQAAVLQPGAILRLQANQSVVWSVAEGRVGGGVTAGGSYTAPRQPGLYHVVATSAEGSNHAVVNIVVTGGKLKAAYVAQPDKNAVSVLAGITGDGLATGPLRETESLAAGQRPVALAISPDGKLLLSANANSNDISVFALLHADGALSVLPGNSFAAGTQPSAAAFDPTGRFVFVTNKGSDDVSVFSVDASGQLVFLRSHAFAAGDKPSAIVVHPDGSVVYVTNAGTNVVQGLAWDAAGMLRPLSGSPSATGTSPSAAVIDSAGKFLFVANRGSGDVSAFAVDVKKETLQEIKGSPFKTGRGATAIAIDLTGSYLFVADHQANDVASLHIDSETGALTLLGRTPLLSAGPTALAVDPSGQYLHVTSDKAGGVTTLKLDVTTGTLVPTGETTARGKASSIVLGSATASTPGP